MSESTIRAQVYAIINAITNIGKVYDYERWAADWTTFINLFKTTISGVEQIRGWEIGRRAAPESGVTPEATIQQTDKQHVFLIRGYMGVNDAAATEKTFNSLCESISDAFRGKLTLNDTAMDHDFIQAEIIEHRLFGGVLCHYAELSLTVHETKNIPRRTP
jgi:hypothetical protein